MSDKMSPSASNNPPLLSLQCLTAYRIVGDMPTLGIVHVLSSGAKRFGELERLTHVNPATLTSRLKQMQNLGLLERREHAVDSQSVTYSLTAIGHKLIPILEQIEMFAEYLPQNIMPKSRH